MNVKFESLVDVWNDQIPMLLITLITLVNTVVFTRDENELRVAIKQLSQNTDFDKFFTYGFGGGHFWLKQRLVSNTSKYMKDRLLLVTF